MKTILPLKIPVISVYSNIANMQAILLNYEQGREWVAQNFINYFVLYDENLKEIKPHFISISDIYFGGNYQMFSQNIFSPFLFCYSVPIKMMDKVMNLISFIKESINNDFYINLFVNRKYVKSASYDVDYTHETFIYGYNDIEKKVYICDYFKGSSYDKFECSYEEIETAFKLCDDYYIAENKKIPIHSVMLVKYNEFCKMNIDIQYIKQSLENYLFSVDLQNTFRFLHTSLNRNSMYYWGINSYDAFINYIDSWFSLYNLASSKVVNHFQHLSDHKKSLKFLIELLCENKMIDDKYVTGIDVIEKSCIVIRNKLIKYRVRGKKVNNKEKIIIMEQLKEIKKFEKNFLLQLLNVLSNCK